MLIILINIHFLLLVLGLFIFVYFPYSRSLPTFPVLVLVGASCVRFHCRLLSCVWSLYLLSGLLYSSFQPIIVRLLAGTPVCRLEAAVVTKGLQPLWISLSPPPCTGRSGLRRCETSVHSCCEKGLCGASRTVDVVVEHSGYFLQMFKLCHF